MISAQITCSYLNFTSTCSSSTFSFGQTFKLPVTLIFPYMEKKAGLPDVFRTSNIFILPMQKHLNLMKKQHTDSFDDYTLTPFFFCPLIFSHGLNYMNF